MNRGRLLCGTILTLCGSFFGTRILPHMVWQKTAQWCCQCPHHGTATAQWCCQCPHHGTAAAHHATTQQPRHGTTEPLGCFLATGCCGCRGRTWPRHQCGAKQPTLTSLASKQAEQPLCCLFSRCWAAHPCLGLDTRVGLNRPR